MSIAPDGASAAANAQASTCRCAQIHAPSARIEEGFGIGHLQREYAIEPLSGHPRPRENAEGIAAALAERGHALVVHEGAGQAGGRRAVTRDAKLLAPVLAAVRKRVGKAVGDDATAFASAFYQRMGDDEVALHEADGWAALAADFLAFLGRRKPGTASVRLFNPTLATHGWETQHTVLQIANDDMPFLVDSVSMALAELGVGVHVLGHPVVALERDRAGKLTRVGAGAPESLIHMEIDRQAPEGCARIEAAVRAMAEALRTLEQLLEREPNIRVVGEAENGREAVEIGESRG